MQPLYGLHLGEHHTMWDSTDESTSARLAVIALEIVGGPAYAEFASGSTLTAKGQRMDYVNDGLGPTSSNRAAQLTSLPAPGQGSDAEA